MRGLRLLLLPVLLIVLSAQGLGASCPSLARLEFCAALPFVSLAIGSFAQGGVHPEPLTAATTVATLDTLLIRTSEGLSRREDDEAKLNELFWNLGLSLDLQRTSERPLQEELVLELGGIASLEAKLDFLTSLIAFMLEKLGGPPSSDEETTLVLNLEDLNIAPGIILKGRSILTLDRDFNFYIDKITLTITNGTLSSETEVEPEGFFITEERLGIRFNLGPITISSGIVIGEGQVTKEVIRMSATSGDLTLMSEASFTADSQEFKVGATIGGLVLSSTSVLTPSGLGSQTFQLELEF
jgi:hypothetical protein